jgi:hypothetical protein
MRASSGVEGCGVHAASIRRPGGAGSYPLKYEVRALSVRRALSVAERCHFGEHCHFEEVLARSMLSMMTCLASFTSPQPSAFTHFSSSRSL